MGWMGREEDVTRSITGILAIAMMASACGSDGTQVTAAAPAPAAEAAVPAPVSEPVTVTQPAPSAPSAPARPSTTSAPRLAAAPSRASTARLEREAPAPAAPAVPEYREFTLPAGTTMSLELKTALASDLSQVEDTVRATLTQAVAVGGHQVLPAGTEMVGTVTEAERSGRVKGRAKVAFQFTSFRYDGERYAMQTEAIEHLAEATKGEDATKVGVGAGAGAVIGGLLGGKAGAAKGAAIGGAAGTGAVLATRGKEVRLEPGTEVPARLAAPLAVRVRLR